MNIETTLFIYFIINKIENTTNYLNRYTESMI